MLEVDVEELVLDVEVLVEVELVEVLVELEVEVDVVVPADGFKAAPTSTQSGPVPASKVQSMLTAP